MLSMSHWRQGLCGLACLAGLLAGVPRAAAQTCPPAPVTPTPAQRQAASAEDRGLLWRLQRDGRTSYLYGTLHVGQPAWMLPGPRVAQALAAAPVLALELDPSDGAVQNQLAEGERDAPTLPPALQARLAQQVIAACLPDGALAALHPAMQAVVLAMLDARWLGLDPAFSQEMALAQGARAAGRRIVSLETVALQKQALVPGDTAAVQRLVEQTLEMLESGSGRRVVARLVQAWEHGDLATLEDHASWCECVRNDEERDAMRQLNDARNPALADGIAALHAQGRPVFAAVGALHMTGPAALTRLLAARGFTVERVPLAR